MQRTLSGIACGLALWATAAGAVHAQDPPAAAPGDTLALTLDEAQRLTLAQNPAFLAERQATEIARGRLRQARTYPLNPEVELDAPGVGVGDGFGVYEAALVQEIEAPGRRRSRVLASEAGLGRAGAEVRDAARLTLAAVSDAFYTALAADRRLEVAEQILALNQSLLAAIRTQRREGEISALQANLAEIEVGRARARVLATRRERTSAVVELKRLTGITLDRLVRLSEGPAAGAPAPELDADSILAVALARRPDLAARSAAVREAQALTALARGESRPNLRVAALAERDEAGGDPRFGIGVGASLPVFNRNQGTVAERRAATARAELERSAAELSIRAEVVAAVQAYRTAAEEVAVYEADVLQPTRANQALLETAYRAGKIDLPALLLVRNQLREAELGYWESWLAFRQARVRLEAVTGASLTQAPADLLPAEVVR